MCVDIRLQKRDQAASQVVFRSEQALQRDFRGRLTR